MNLEQKPIDEGKPPLQSVTPTFRCDTCGWIGTEKEMAADYTQEAWSNTVCPSCHTWDNMEQIEDNIKLTGDK